MQAWCQSPLSSSQGYKHTSLCHGSRTVQPLTGCCTPARSAHSPALEPGHGNGEIPARCQTSPHPATAPCLCQNKPSTLPHSDPCPSPGCLHASPLPSLPILLPAAMGVGAQRGLLERARGSFGKGRDGGAVGRANVASLVGQTAGLVLKLLHLLTSSILAQGNSLAL